MKLIGNCTELNGDDIEDMVNQSEEITAEEFRMHVSNPIVIHGQGFNEYSKYYCVGFYKSNFRGKPCVYTEHSRIEFVYTYRNL